MACPEDSSMEEWLKHRYDDLPLHALCLSPNIEMDVLQECAAKFNTVQEDEFQMTPLHLLVLNRFSSPEMIKSLVSHTSNKTHLLAARDANHQTPLHYACLHRRNNLEIIQALAGRDADTVIHLKDKYNKCATALAIDSLCSAEIQDWLYNCHPIEAKDLNLDSKTATELVELLASVYIGSLVQRTDWDSNFTRLDQNGWVRWSAKNHDNTLLEKVVDFIGRSDQSIARALADAIDLQGQKAINTAQSKIKDALLSACAFFGRYNLESSPMYESKTCTVFFAQDILQCQPHESDVALKFFQDKSQFEAERCSRFRDPTHLDSARFDPKHVLGAIQIYNGDVDASFKVAAENHKLSPYCIVLREGGRTLSEAIVMENLSADRSAVRSVLSDLAHCLKHIHEEGYVHGDFKPRNAVRSVDGGEGHWSLIDFDAAIRIGETISSKCSTAYIPPEAVRITDIGPVVLPSIASVACTSGENQPLSADPSFDVWSFGVTMYQLISGYQLLDGVDINDNLKEDQLKVLSKWSRKKAEIKLGLLAASDSRAKDLLGKILNKDPASRPSMEEVLQHPYFYACPLEPAISVELEGERDGSSEQDLREKELRHLKARRNTMKKKKIAHLEQEISLLRDELSSGRSEAEKVPVKVEEEAHQGHLHRFHNAPKATIAGGARVSLQFERTNQEPYIAMIISLLRGDGVYGLGSVMIVLMMILRAMTTTNLVTVLASAQTRVDLLLESQVNDKEMTLTFP
eukprot:CAMPEP_0172451686 /NCGR_PEP_ID=MMETSP1065-20121228/9621_1 /TAXON_ID=265537 /ORGANISM="Amphiprora paludosa, Strain CCMP125" /LENGTH=744 /DNA_ID=CAMNT_0013203653 /DNA_START=147 /DNA_END=2382 /DNA_ORIENTATION=-